VERKERRELREERSNVRGNRAKCTTGARALLARKLGSVTMGSVRALYIFKCIESPGTEGMSIQAKGSADRIDKVHIDVGPVFSISIK
jgi:hypothetical protein